MIAEYQDIECGESTAIELDRGGIVVNLGIARRESNQRRSGVCRQIEELDATFLAGERHGAFCDRDIVDRDRDRGGVRQTAEIPDRNKQLARRGTSRIVPARHVENREIPGAFGTKSTILDFHAEPGNRRRISGERSVAQQQQAILDSRHAQISGQQEHRGQIRRTARQLEGIEIAFELIHRGRIARRSGHHARSEEQQGHRIAGPQRSDAILSGLTRLIESALAGDVAGRRHARRAIEQDDLMDGIAARAERPGKRGRDRARERERQQRGDGEMQQQIERQRRSAKAGFLGRFRRRDAPEAK